MSSSKCLICKYVTRSSAVLHTGDNPEQLHLRNQNLCSVRTVHVLPGIVRPTDLMLQANVMAVAY